MSEIEQQFATVRASIRKAAESTDDPFEAFNAAQGMGSIRDPYPIFAGMRAVAPVHKIDMGAMFEGAGNAPGASGRWSRPGVWSNETVYVPLFSP